MVRSRLSAQLRRRLDAEDVLQSAFRSFFVGVRAGRFEIERGGDLWRLLVGITLNKLHTQAAFHHAGKRSVALEEPRGARGSLESLQPSVLARDPSPVQAALLAEEVELLMQRLTPLDRRILELRLQGCDVCQIATETNRSLATIYRVLERIKLALEHPPPEPGPASDACS